MLILTERSRIGYAKDLLVNALLTAMANPRMNTNQRTRAMENAESKKEK